MPSTSTASSLRSCVCVGVAALVNAGNVSEVSLVDNATTAATIVLQHAAWSFAEGRFARGDGVLMLHYAYGAVKKSIEAYAARAGVTAVEVSLPFPVASPDAIIAESRATLAVAKAGGRRVQLAVIDHITSMLGGDQILGRSAAPEPCLPPGAGGA